LQVFHPGDILSFMSIDHATAVLLHTALTGSSEALLSLLQKNPSVEIIRAALKNPALGEVHLLAVLKHKDLSEEIIRVICGAEITGSSHQIKCAIAGHPGTSAHQLALILPQLFLFELLAICYLPHVSPDQKLAAERAIIQRLPVTPLGNRMALARRATSAILEALMKEGDCRLLEICLSNPRLKEGAVFQFLRGANATAETISLVARNQRWRTRPNIREAILTNPKTPLIWFSLWLPGMKTSELKRLISSNRLAGPQKKAVEERLKKG
jgi:hypothetical protein